MTKLYLDPADLMELINITTDEVDAISLTLDPDAYNEQINRLCFIVNDQIRRYTALTNLFSTCTNIVAGISGRHEIRVPRRPSRKPSKTTAAICALQHFREHSTTCRNEPRPLTYCIACNTDTDRTNLMKIDSFEMPKIDDRYPDEWYRSFALALHGQCAPRTNDVEVFLSQATGRQS